MTEIYSQGSMWRKWDLHVHTPASIYQNYGENNDITWEKYLKDLEALPKEFAVLGINDYFFIDGYERLKKEKEENNRIPNITRIFPVVEFRIDKFAGVDFGALKRINLHVLFSDEVPIETIKSQFLNTLEQSYYLEKSGVQWSRAITKESVEELGKNIKASVPVAQLSKYGPDLIEGFNNLNVKEERIFESLKKDCFKDKYLIAIGKTEWADLKWTDSSIGTKKSIINGADIVFTAAKSKEEFDKAKAKLKAEGVNDLLLDCSDSHYYSTSTDKDRIGNCLTWIKADPTFEGLKQIKYEPDRVYIGSASPQAKDVNRIISSVQILNSGGWFDEMEMPLNPDLCCVIGSKGSGKTALADLIGFAGGDIGDKIKAQKSFLGKAIKELANTQIKIKWLGGHEDTVTIGVDKYESLPKKVQYLSQGFVEEICSEDMDGDELVQEIEKVIFENLDEADKRNYGDFESLRKAKTDSINQKKVTFQSSIVRLNSEIFTLEQQIKSLPEKKRNKESLEKEKEGIEKQKKEITYSTEEEQKTEEAIDKLQHDLSALISQVATLKTNLQTITDLKNRIEIFEVQTSEFYSSLLSDLRSIGIVDENLSKFEIKINHEAKGLLEEKQKAFEVQILKLQGDEAIENPVPNTLVFLEREIEGLRKKSTLEKSKKDKLDTFQKRSKEIEIALEKLTAEIADIESTKSGTLSERASKRLEQYNLFFKTLREEKEILVKLYEPIQRKLHGSMTSEEQLLGFETKEEVDHVKLGDAIMTVLNRKKRGKFLNTSDDKVYTEIKEVYNKILNSANDEERIKNLEAFLNSFSAENNSIEEHLKDNYSLKDFFNAVFATEYFKLKYSLNFGGIALDNLTPGTKGIALLILYLGINQNEYRPLIIDQPEENLDNRSVYKVLKDYFRNAKLRRQIIMVTHNPNLVVNTDAEQVIIANFDKEKKKQTAKICYISGSLENTKVFDDAIGDILGKQGIREHTCEILEGGVRAFEEREHKYRIN